MRQSGVRAQAGFTLIEVMVVVVILGLLATMVAVRVFPAHAQAQKQTALADIKAIDEAARLFMIQNGSRVPTIEQLTTPDDSGHVWAEIGLDPWGSEYRLVPLDEPGRPFEVLSLGADGEEGTEDDITSRDLRRKAD